MVSQSHDCEIKKTVFSRLFNIKLIVFFVLFSTVIWENDNVHVMAEELLDIAWWKPLSGSVLDAALTIMLGEAQVEARLRVGSHQALLDLCHWPSLAPA